MRTISTAMMDEGCDTDVTSTDTRAVEPARRRRGAALEDAILAAAFTELTEVGYQAFSVEGVATRAHTGKGSIYRRWPTKADLVLDALVAEMPSPQDVGLGPDCRLDDSVTTAEALHRIGRTIAKLMTSSAGAAMRAIKLETTNDPKLAALVDERFQAPRRAALLRILERGVERGEVRPDAAVPLVADVLPAVLMHRFLMQDDALDWRDVRDIIAKVIIPLVEARP